MRCAQHNNFAHRLKLGENCDLDGSSCLQPSRQVLPRSDGCRMLLLPCKVLILQKDRDSGCDAW
ncbi:uncharacterized protein [Physcomitrium patens]|uniref:uncharacterized protein isoform X11 n=1 Tax=Physcomitrium patens TaxID=3218 RepID=UPI003CCDC9F7